MLKRLLSRSVGCVVIELLEGQPPYHSLEPMQALFRIVQDDSPPIPEGASGVSNRFTSQRDVRITKLTYIYQQVVKDFMYQCFQKDPNLRITAQKLAKHPWMLATKRQIDSAQPKDTLSPILSSSTAAENVAESGTSVAHRKPPQVERKSPKFIITKRRASNQPPRVIPILNGSTSEIKEKAAIRIAQGKALAGGETSLPDLHPRPLTTVYDDAIQRVQAWNEALQGKHFSWIWGKLC
jgi:serine/threonine protein kinase